MRLDLEGIVNQVFWLVENEVCGRPGPNHVPWDASELRAGGIGAVLSVNSGKSVPVQALIEAGIDHHCVPLAANAPPRPGEKELCLERLPVAYAYVRSQIEDGKAVLVHCRHGKDRTGLFMAYYLVRRLGLSPRAAFDAVREKRPTAFTAEGWDRFVIEVLESCS